MIRLESRQGRVRMRWIGDHKGFLILAAGLFGVHSVMNATIPLSSDEAFYWDWSRHLALGYYTHPPFTGWIIALFTALFGHSEYAVRLPALLMHLGTATFVYLLGYEYSRSPRFSVLSALIFAVMPLFVVLGSAIVTDSPLVFFATGTVYFGKKAIVEGRKGFWYPAGLMAGGALLTKFFGVLVFPSLFFFILFRSRYRHLLVSKEPYLALLLSQAVLLPFYYWNATNDWLTFQFNLFIRHGSGASWVNPFLYPAGQLLAASPLLFLLILVACRNALRRPGGAPGWPAGGTPEEDRARETMVFLAYVALFPLLFFLPLSYKVRIGAHWAGIMLPAAAVLVTAWFHGAPNAPPAGRLSRPKWFWAALLTAGLISLPLASVLTFPRLLPDRYLYYDAEKQRHPVAAEYFGWEEAGLRVNELRREYGGRPEGVFLAASSHSLAAMMDYYTPGGAAFTLVDYPESPPDGKELLMWGREVKKPGANLIFVSNRPVFPQWKKRLLRYFDSVEELEPLPIRDSEGRLIRYFHFALGRNYKGGEPDRISIW